MDYAGRGGSEEFGNDPNNELPSHEEIVVTNVSSEENVVIHHGGGRELTVDIFRPANLLGPVQGLLFLPGGGWQTANRAPLKERYGLRMAERGYVCVAGEYRVMDEAPWPAQIQDVKAMIRWMRANSEHLGIDPTAIMVGGKSAGGHLALLAAGTRGIDAFEGDGGNTTVSSEVAAVIGVAPVTDLTEWARRPTMAKLFGENPSAEVVRAASPIAHVNGDYPPTLLVHGTADTRVPHTMTMRMYQALEQAGVPVDLYLFAGQDHFFDQEPQFCEAIADAMAFFIARFVPARVAVTTS
jgi:acetyl esterase/lipase